jgi:hypothetical protein
MRVERPRMDDQRSDRQSGGSVKIRFSLKRLLLSMGLVCATLGILVSLDEAIPFETLNPVVSLFALLLAWGLCAALISVAILLPFIQSEK